MLQLIGGTVGMMDISRGLNPQQVRSINKAVRGVQVSNSFVPDHALPVSHISRHFCASAQFKRHCCYTARTITLSCSWKQTVFAAH